MLGDRLAEGRPLLRVRDGLFESSGCHTDRTCTHVDATDLDPVQHLLETAAFLTAQQVGRLADERALVEQRLEALQAEVTALRLHRGEGA